MAWIKKVQSFPALSETPAAAYPDDGLGSDEMGSFVCFITEFLTTTRLSQ